MRRRRAATSLVAFFVTAASLTVTSLASAHESSLFLIIDEDSIGNGVKAIEEIAESLGVDASELVNDDIADPGVRVPLAIPKGTMIGKGSPIGTNAALASGEIGDEGWFALRTIPSSWDSAGPDDGLRNFVNAAPGLGTGNDPEQFLDKIPDVTPLRTADLRQLVGQPVCALVFESDVSINEDPLEGSLKGANLGLIAFDVVAIGSPDDEVLPDVTIRIRDTRAICDGELELFHAPRSITVGIAYDPGPNAQQSLYNLAVKRGAHQAQMSLGAVLDERFPAENDDLTDVLDDLAAGSDLVIAFGFRYGDLMLPAALAHGDTNFAIIDFDLPDHPEENLQNVTFATNEGAFLAGAAAALTTQTGKVRFIGALRIPVIECFAVGFEEGAERVNPNIDVDSEYLTLFPDFSGFVSPPLGYAKASAMYSAGVDVIEHASGSSGLGVFDAARDFSQANNPQVWAIGVDNDQYQGVDGSVQPHILTSMVKRYDTVTFDIIFHHQNGAFTGGHEYWDMARGGLDYATSGGFLNAHIPTLERLRNEIISGAIEVPLPPSIMSCP